MIMLMIINSHIWYKNFGKNPTTLLSKMCAMERFFCTISLPNKNKPPALFRDNV